MARKKQKERTPFVPRDPAQIFADEMGDVLKQMRAIVQQARVNLEKQEDYLWFQRMNLVGIEKEIEAMENERRKSLDVLGGVNADMHEIGALYAQSVRQRDALLMWMQTWGITAQRKRQDRLDEEAK